MEDQHPYDLTLDLDDLGEGVQGGETYITIERTWSKLRDLELRLNGHTIGLNPRIPPENHIDALNRWLSETTEEGFYHTIGQVRQLQPLPPLPPPPPPKSSASQFNYAATHPDNKYEKTSSEAYATCGILSEVSRGLSRL
ncbi:hypothetical protein TWF694_006990 [Orbilia ellipsospora]|uniref:Uncharacterized protein n=1 Tax=Orbilia ellipsospora TaxID=2528407 RepID=A0AAV9XLV3_9PEZI